MADGPGRRRIILFCDSPIAGGYEQFVASFANALGASGFEVEFWYWHERFEQIAVHPALVKRRLPFTTKTPLPFLRSFNPLAIRRLVRLFKSRPRDLLIICQGSIEIGARALIAGRIVGTPTVSYLARAFDLRATGSRLGHVREMVDRIFYRLPAAFIALSEFQRSLIATRVSTPVHLIPVVMAGEAGPLRPMHERGPTLELGVIGAVAFHTKGQDAMPALMRRLRERGTAARLHVVGGGGDLEPLGRSAASAGVADDFVVHGEMPYGAPRETMRNLDVLVIPSRSEGTVPLVAFEALDEGLPFVMSDLDSIAEWRIPQALLFDRESPDDTARAIDAALAFRASPEFAPFRERMLASVSERAFVDHAARLVENLLSP